MRYICTLCNDVLDESKGFPEAGIKPGQKFEEMPDDWHCPVCAASKEFFQPCSCVSWPIYELTKFSTPFQPAA